MNITLQDAINAIEGTKTSLCRVGTTKGSAALEMNLRYEMGSVYPWYIVTLKTDDKNYSISFPKDSLDEAVDLFNQHLALLK